ncbi:MAG: hypothetical protein Q7U04_16985 [Bacteriovorax sp.]|nr:hypothetical protein [Bacteriovorax sp.]
MKKFIVSLFLISVSSTVFARVSDNRIDIGKSSKGTFTGSAHVVSVQQINSINYGDGETVLVTFSEVAGRDDLIGQRLFFSGKDLSNGKSLMSLLGKNIYIQAYTGSLTVSELR